MKTQLDVRSLKVELRAATDFSVEGVAVSYNTPSAPIGGQFVETIKPGAFTRSLASGRDIKCLINHDANRILGRRKNGTLTLTDSSVGLSFRCQLDKNNSSHRDLYSQVQRGDMDECSFAFSADDSGQQWNAARTQRTITRADLFDVSIVCFPAYPGDATNVQARNAATAHARLGSYPVSKADWRARALAVVRALQPEVDAIAAEKRAAAAVTNTISRHAADLTSEAVAEMFED